MDTPSLADPAPVRSVVDPPLPAHAQACLKALTRADPDFRRVLRRAGDLPWRTRAPGFAGLLNAIVGQQISIAAATAIWGRLCALNGCLDPNLFLLLTDEALRTAGLSRPKILHARAVAEAFRDGVLATDALAAMDDETAVATICSVRGLGVWSAEIYLLFALQRQDVFPAGDLALQAAAADLKGLPARPTAKALRHMAEAWQPNRAMAARLLWHWWRHLSGRPAM